MQRYTVQSYVGIRKPFKFLNRSSIFQTEIFAIPKADEVAFNAPAGISIVNIYVEIEKTAENVKSKVPGKHLSRIGKTTL